MTASPLPMAASAQGSYVYDETGKDYLDASSGVLNVNLGHGNPQVLAAIRDQLAKVTFTHRTQFANRPLARLTEELLAVAPAGTGHVEYANSGSEANECALRIALAYHHRTGSPGRTVVLSEQPSYHGMTAGALALTGQPPKLDPSFAPLLPSALAADGSRVRPVPGALRAGTEQWRHALDTVGRARVAAVIVEPVGGSSSGAAPMAEDTLRWLRAEADHHGFLLIADEVMSGFGRTGRWWACDHAGVAPDLLTSGKGLTGGYTSLAVTLVQERVAAAFERPLGSVVLGHTMSGNPLAAAASLAVLRQLRGQDLPARAAVLGAELLERLSKLGAPYPLVTGVRGRGLMLGLGLSGDPARPLELSRTLIAAARRHGLILCPGGIDATTESVMVAPPLTTSDHELTELLRRLECALGELPAPVR
ncbi:aminotransferase family protein [Streptomyces orinoci]|uniref:Aminotransferase class III-fold pyridoxal phosphate-dependent enzyme n=1 Tax=Streptomyces orinoci TaxID=67339 RepID=A0ABV3JUC0_STRON|nr:aminotransferase class III-fold pyridoxal phosphate-dependent enzyme [Streptomyces orinoci]